MSLRACASAYAHRIATTDKNLLFIVNTSIITITTIKRKTERCSCPVPCTVRMVRRVGRASRRAKRGGPVPVRGEARSTVCYRTEASPRGLGVGVGEVKGGLFEGT